jgi:hypothetical protein
MENIINHKIKTMKNLLLTCCLVIAALSVAKAQVPKSNFNAGVNELSLFIKKKNVVGMNNCFNGLNEMMNTQIAYLTSTNNTLTRRYLSEKAKAENDKIKAIAVLKASAIEATSNPKQASADSTKALADITSAQTEETQAAGDWNIINQNADKLKIEKNSSAELQKLKNNIPANQNNIINNLNAFAATL